MNCSTRLGALALISVLASPVAMANDTDASVPVETVKKTSYTNAQGSQLEVVKGIQTDEDGNTHYGKAWRATDKDGDIRGQGKTTATVNQDGSKSTDRKAIRYRDNGETIKRHGQAQDDGQGNKRVRRGQNVYDENGDLVRQRRNKARDLEDGSKTRIKKRRRVNDDGSVSGQYRRTDKNADGARRVKKARGRTNG